MMKTNLFFATLLLGLATRARADPDAEFLAKIAMGPYRDGSDYVHHEPGDGVHVAVLENVAVIPNVPMVGDVPSPNDELRKQLASGSDGQFHWPTDASTLITWERYRHKRYEGDFGEETENDKEDNKTAVDSKAFYIRGQRRGRGKGARKYHVESWEPRKRHLRRSRRHRREEDDTDGSCTEDYRHCRRRHNRRGRHVSRSSSRSRSVERSRRRSSRRDRSLSTTRRYDDDSRDRSRSRDRNRDRRSRRRTSRDRRDRRSRRDDSRDRRRDRKYSRDRDDSRDRNSSRDRSRSRGNYGRYQRSYGSANNNFAALSRTGKYLA